MTAGAIAKIMLETGLANPHSTQLAQSMRKSGLLLESTAGFRLKATARATVREWLEPILDGFSPKIDHTAGYIAEAIWIETRPYIERVCVQVNACFALGYFDAASVMLRRLTETLIIEGYEGEKREHEIKGADGNYFMLGELVIRAASTGGLRLGRDAKTTLTRIKQQGDRSAHNRRFTAVRADLTEIQSGVRVLVQELIAIAGLK